VLFSLNKEGHMNKKEVGISFKIDIKIRDKFKKIAKNNNTNMASLLKIYIEDYNKKYLDEFIKKSQTTMFK